MLCRACHQDKPPGEFDGSRRKCKECKRADMRAYSRTPAGRAAKARSHQRHIEQRRAARQIRINPQPLAQAVSTWRIQ